MLKRRASAAVWAAVYVSSLVGCMTASNELPPGVRPFAEVTLLFES